MELIAIIVAGLLGWQNGGFGKRELQIIALVVIGWSAVTSAAAVPYLTLGGLLYDRGHRALRRRRAGEALVRAAPVTKNRPGAEAPRRFFEFQERKLVAQAASASSPGSRST